MLLVACERGAPPEGADSAPASATTPDASPAVQPACPATGLWSACGVLDRLERAGLAPRFDSAGASEPPLTVAGRLLRVGNSELELYFYQNPSARERDLATLDRTKYVSYDAPVPMRPVPTLITSANLIAILHSRNDHQRERVADAITAGPPQPQQPARP